MESLPVQKTSLFLWEIESESSFSDSGSNLFSKDLELNSQIWSDNSINFEESGSDDSPGQPRVKNVLLPCLSEERGDLSASACD